MIDQLKTILVALPAAQQLNGLREYLQRLLLQAIDDSGFRKNIAFVGGTALRIIYGTDRFSEDLNFSLVDRSGYSTTLLCAALLARLEKLGLTADASTVKDEKTVSFFFIRFCELLQPLGLSSERDQKLSIKIEVDKWAPAGATIEEYVAQDPLLFIVRHYDLPSLFATTPHAILFRRYAKGRDFYDLFFLCGKPIHPDLTVFRNAVKQTHPHRAFANLGELYSAVEDKVRHLDEKQILRDVAPFLLRPEDERFLHRDILMKVLAQKQSQIKTGK